MKRRFFSDLQPSTMHLRPSCPTEESNLDRQFRRLSCLHHTRGAIRFHHQSRRLDSHQHHPVYKTGAFLSRATSADEPSFQSKHERKESNPAERFWRPPASPEARSQAGGVVRRCCSSRRGHHGKHGSSRKETNTSGRQGSRTHRVTRLST